MRKLSLAAVMLALSLLPFSSRLSLAASMPTVPTGLAAVAGFNYLISLSWNASTSSAAGAIKYRVIRDGTAIGSRQKARTYADHPSAGTHAYQVVAIDAKNHKSAPSAAVTVAAAARVAPANLAGSVSADGGAALSWDPVAGASGYEVLRGELVAWRTSATSFTDYPAGRLAQSYHYRVRGVDASGEPGPESTSVTVTVDPSRYALAGLKISHGSRDEKIAAITIDDCYGMANMQAMVAILRAKHAPATFNCVGDAMKGHPAFFAELAQDFPIGNHTWDHKRMTRLTRAQIIDEMTRTTDLIEQITGRPMPAIMRPPGGYANAATLTVLRELGLPAITWDELPGTLSKVNNGAIVLFHPRTAQVARLGPVIDELRAKGFRLVTEPEMFGLPWQPAS